MLNQMILINFDKKPGTFFDIPVGGNWVLWETCRRKVYLSKGEEIPDVDLKDAKIFKGVKAYQYLLEIVTGLYSPILGETAICSQFKEFYSTFELSNITWSKEFHDLCQNILKDGKKIRSDFFTGAGQQSYGSATQFHIQGSSEIHILGAGNLTKEMLPLLVKEKVPVKIFCRNQSKVTPLKEVDACVELLNMNETHKTAVNHKALVIAASMKSVDVEKWIKNHQYEYQVVVDLRDITTDQALSLEAKIIVLEDIFSEIERTHKRLEKQASHAKKIISQMAKKKEDRIVIRPFGWEELCF